MFNIPAVHLLTASIIAGLIGISTFILGPAVIGPAATVRIEPQHGLTVMGDTFTVALIVEANVPVNVFKGLVTFDDEKLEVASIDYNTSIADLWAEEPWYSNGDGTLNFTGGTTRDGGFIGEGSLVTITFHTKATGDAHIALTDMRILRHDGLGSDVTVTKPLDSIFAIESETQKTETVFENSVSGPTVSVIPSVPDTDLNDDGKQTVADVSIFMADYATKNLRSDFNQDAKVDLRDLSIITQQ